MDYGFNAHGVYGFNTVHGFGFGSVALANIIYNMDTFNVDTLLRTLDNAGKNGASSDGEMYGSNHVFLNGIDQSIDYPIAHTLGSEAVVNGSFDTDVSGWSSLSGGILTWNSGVIEVTNIPGDTYYGASQTITTEIGKTYLVEVEIVSGSQARIGVSSTQGSETYFGFSSVSLHSGVFIATTTTTFVDLKGTDDTTNIFDNISLKEVTNPNSFLTYFDTATKSHITLGNSVDGGSSEELYFAPTSLDTGWTDNGDGTFTSDGTSSFLRFLNMYTVGKDYRGGIEVVSHTSGTVSNFYDGIGLGSAFLYDTPGTYYWAITPGATLSVIYSNGFTGTIRPFSVKEILPVSTTYNQINSHSNTFALTKVRTESEMLADNAYLDANPEAVAKLVDGETVAGLSFVLADIHNFYPCNEGEASGAYVQDVSVALGSEEITNHDFSLGDVSWIKSNGSTIVTDLATVVGNGSLTSGAVNWGLRQDSVVEVGKIYIISVRARQTVGTGNFLVGFGWENTLDIQITDSFVTYSVVALAIYSQVAVGGITIGDEFEVEFVSFREATVQEIANFTTASRTTLQNTNYGCSNLLYKQRADGGWLSMADANLIDFKNSGGAYVATAWKPNLENYTMVETVSGLLQNFSNDIHTDFEESYDPDNVGTLSSVSGGSFTVVSIGGGATGEAALRVQTAATRTVTGVSLLGTLKITVNSGSVKLDAINTYGSSGTTEYAGTYGIGTHIFSYVGINLTTRSQIYFDSSIAFDADFVFTAKELTTTTQREEFRALTHEEGVGNEYRINNVLQDEVPLPDPDTFIDLDTTAKIGYTDSIDAEGVFTIVKDRVLTSGELVDAYNKAKLIYPTLP